MPEQYITTAEGHLRIFWQPLGIGRNGNPSGMAGVRYGRRIHTMSATGEGEAGEVNGCGRRSGKRRNLCGTRCFGYDRTEMRDSRVGG